MRNLNGNWRMSRGIVAMTLAAGMALPALANDFSLNGGDAGKALGVETATGLLPAIRVEATPADGNPAGKVVLLRIAPDATAQASGGFAYNHKTGTCQNAQGQQGFNHVTLDQLQRTKNGECADLGGIALNGSDLGYPKLTGWNLKGASLNKASLYFALLVDADLRGAQMDGFSFGYARITATIDSFTQLSKETITTGICKTLEGAQLECSN